MPLEELLDELVQQLAWWVEAVAEDEPVPEEAADRYAADEGLGSVSDRDRPI